MKDALADPLMAVFTHCEQRPQVPLTRAELRDAEIEGMLLEAIEVTVRSTTHHRQKCTHGRRLLGRGWMSTAAPATPSTS